MANVFDQFDAPTERAPNPFDQFDPPTQQRRGDGLALNATAGLNDALATIAGAPVDAMTGIMNRAFGDVARAAGQDYEPIEKPFLGSDWIKDRAGAIHPVLNPDNTEARTMGERIARGAGEGVGYTVGPQAVVGGFARSGKALDAASRFVGRPGSVGELIAGSTAGAGATAGMELAPDRYDALAATAGGLTGGIIGAGIANAPRIAHAAWDAASDFIAPMSEAGRQRLAGQQLYDGATDPAAVRRALDDGIDEIVPGSQPTTFQQSGDLGLGGMERGAAARRPDLFAERRAAQNAARIDALTSIQDKGAPETVARSVREHLARIDDETQTALNAATQAAQGRTAGIGTGASPEASGSAMRQALETARQAAKEQERALWRAVDPDGTLALHAGATKTASQSIAREIPRSAKPMAGEEAAIHGVLQQYDDVVPFSELTALQSRLKAELRAERLANGETPAYRRLTQLNQAIETDLETAIAGKVAQEADAVARGVMDERDTLFARYLNKRDEWLAERQQSASARFGGEAGAADFAGGRPPAVSGQVGAGREAGGGFGIPSRNQGLPGDALEPNFDEAALGRLRQARDATRNRVETFDNRTLGPIRRRPSTNSPYELPAGVVPERIFNASPSSPEAIRRFRSAVGDERALPVIEEYAVDRVRAFTMDPDGTVNASRLAAWRRRHQEALRSFPELDARLGDASHASEAIDRAARARKLRLDDARKGKLGALLNVDDPTDIVNTVGSVFGRNDSLQQMSRIRSAIKGDQEALEGLKKATVDYMMNRFVGNTEVATSGQAGIRSDQFQTFIRQNKQALRAAGFSDDDVSRMAAIADDLQRANRSIAGVRIPGGSNTTQDIIAAGDRSMSNFGRLISIAGAGVGAAYNPLAAMAGVVGGQAISSMRRAGLATVDDLVADALLNPSVARILLSKAQSRPGHGVWKALANHYSQAARVSVAKGAEQSAQPERSAR